MSDSLKSRKSKLRKDIKRRLDAMTAENRHERSVAVCRRVQGLEQFQHASTVMMYMPLPSEVDILPLAISCFQAGRTVCVPDVNWERKEIRPVEITSIADDVMELDEHGIRIPREGGIILPTQIDLVLIPGIAFDTQGNRLGRGAGFYDRFLRRLSRDAATVAAAFDEQVVDDVPIGPHDICVQVLVTDRRTTWATTPTRQ